MKTVNINDVLGILYKYGEFIFITDEKKYTEMMNEITNLPSTADTIFDKIRAEILEEKDCAYADFEQYKVEYLGQDWEDVYDSLPQDDFRYGMERCVEIIDKYKRKNGDKEI